MAKMKNNTVNFIDGDLNCKAWNSNVHQFVTPEAVLLTWANVNQHDEENLAYQAAFQIPVDGWGAEFRDAVTAWENEQRDSVGEDEVEIASIFLTQNGDVRISDCGNFYEIRASGKTNEEPYTLDSGKEVGKFQKNKPRVYDINGNRDDDIQIWAGDMVKVSASLGFYRSSNNYGTKLYIKGVQQIEAGAGPTNTNPFGDESDNTDDALPF